MMKGKEDEMTYYRDINGILDQTNSMHGGS